MLLDKVRYIIKKHRLIERGERLVIGVSGGPDSVALLYVLNSLKRELKLTLHIAHLDHMLRKDSCKDAEFVQRLAQRLKIPITSGQIRVKELARKGSLEEIARNARLGFLFRVAKDIKTRKIALGHNLDDQAETVLMRILRGCGLYGLAGILPKREISGFQIIRPLIEVRRREINAYLKQRGIRPRLDASNLEDIYLRNKIRNRLLPLLEEGYNKNIKDLLCNLAECAGMDYDYLDKRALRFLKQFRKLNLKKIMALHPALLRLVLRKSIAYLAGNTRRLTFRHMQELEDLIYNRPINSIVDLPGNICVIKKKNHLSINKKAQ
jgi:tRNA(Ile)-lysidine synthase